MSRPHIPPPRIDLKTLPPWIATSDAGSFAANTVKVRDPNLLQELINAPYLSFDIKNGLKKFQAEILGGEIQPLRHDAPDAEFWKQISKPYIGRTWFDVPWYWAETFFYRRILDLVGYFEWGAWHERDPFAPMKDAELKPEAAPARVRHLLNALGERTQSANEETFVVLMHAALWGNRVDLSYNVEQTVGRAANVHDERENLLTDDAPRIWEFFKTHTIQQLAYVTDNAGTELSYDLALMDYLLTQRLVEKIVVHLKPQPFYVSDAMPQDVLKTLEAFDKANDETRAMAQRLRALQSAARLELRTHWFYPTSLHYFEMPDDLFAQFRAADFCIFKGDVNYRRLVGDAHWKPTLNFDYPTRYFPAPFVALRTMKSDCIVGLHGDQVAALDNADRAWRVNGKRGVAQARLGNQ